MRHPKAPSLCMIDEPDFSRSTWIGLLLELYKMFSGFSITVVNCRWTKGSTH